MYPWQTFILGLCEHLAWPVFVAVCIVYYREDIRRILGRIKTLPGGAELTPETEEKQEENKNMYNELLAKRNEAQKKAMEKFEKMAIKNEKNKQDKGGKK